MSEPFSAVLKVTISRPKLLAYFQHIPVPASHWSDWPEIGGSWYQFNYATDLPRLLAEVNRRLAGHYLACNRRLLNPGIPAMSRLQYDRKDGSFIFANLMLAENLGDIVEFLTVARGIAPFLTGSDRGFAVVHNYLWGSDTVAVLGLEPDRSSFLNNVRNLDAYETNIRQGVAVLDRIIQDGEHYDSTLSTERVESFFRDRQPK